MKSKLSVIGLLLILLSTNIFSQIDTSVFRGMKARSIGPAGMSGRIAAIDAVVGDDNIIYVGSATGGVWKSTNGGIVWNSIFDNQPVSSIGAIAVYQANPTIIWVGTGESNIRNSAGVGRGVYKSLDAGKTWQFVGLEKTETISRIQLDPTNPDIAYVGALGTNWGETSERGLYKTTDGGKTWKNILYVNERTGVGDFVMDPKNPNKLIVSMWEHRRWPWFFKSGGNGSGLYISIDAGNNWKQITFKDGLPKGELGKIGLAIAPNRTNIVYALVEAKKSVLLRSEDGGYKWKTVNSEPNINPRPFYFGRLMVNPVNENLLYKIEYNLRASEDGGKSFQNIQGQIHVDNHALWIHPNGETLIAGNDGGIAISRDRGKTWRFVENLPLAQFYHISIDNDFPYHVYGGLQDNGSWRGPSNSFKGNGIYNSDWEFLSFGDGFDIQPDPDDSYSGYSMSQEGYLYRYNLKTGNMKLIRPTETDVKDRYNWNSGFALDPFNSSTIYYGSQFLHKSTDKGKTWTVISPDLTTNDTSKQKQNESGGVTIDATGAENFTTILAISPSSLKQGIIWVGTDDGNIQLTRDGGKSWNLVSTYLADNEMVPEGTWIPRIKASKHDPASAYVVFDNHRRHDWNTYVFVTHNYGETWQSLSNENIDGFALTIEEDPVNKNLLFLGTEFALYFSIDAGKNWTKWTHGLPTAPYIALKIHPRENDLVIGTYGRAIYIIDDISPLREISNEILNKDSHLFKINDAIEFFSASAGRNWFFVGDAEFKGENKPYGAMFTYYLNLPDSIKKLEGTKDEKKSIVQIIDSSSQVIRTFKSSMKQGINRAFWDLRKKAALGPRDKSKPDEDSPGILVLPGRYTVKIKSGNQIMQQSFSVLPDPRLNIDLTKFNKNYQFKVNVEKLIDAARKSYNQINETLKSIETIKTFAANMDSSTAKETKSKADSLKKKLISLANKITPDSSLTGYRNESGILTSEIGEIRYLNMDSLDEPYENAKVKYEKVKKLAENLFDQLNELYSKDVVEFENFVNNKGFSVFKKHETIKIEQ